MLRAKGRVPERKRRACIKSKSLYLRKGVAHGHEQRANKQPVHPDKNKIRCCRSQPPARVTALQRTGNQQQERTLCRICSSSCGDFSYIGRPDRLNRLFAAGSVNRLLTRNQTCKFRFGVFSASVAEE